MRPTSFCLPARLGVIQINTAIHSHQAFHSQAKSSVTHSLPCYLICLCVFLFFLLFFWPLVLFHSLLVPLFFRSPRLRIAIGARTLLNSGCLFYFIQKHPPALQPPLIEQPFFILLFLSFQFRSLSAVLCRRLCPAGSIPLCSWLLHARRRDKVRIGLPAWRTNDPPPPPLLPPPPPPLLEQDSRHEVLISLLAHTSPPCANQRRDASALLVLPVWDFAPLGRNEFLTRIQTFFLGFCQARQLILPTEPLQSVAVVPIFIFLSLFCRCRPGTLVFLF